MNKDNIFRSSNFYMAEGDVLHIIIKDETGAVPLILLQGEVTDTAPSSPTVDDATNITSNSFSANWLFMENATGYYLDVSTDALFEYMVSGYDNRDVGNVATLSVTGLATGTPYYYRVRAYNDVGTSGDSGTATLTTTAVATLVDLDGNEYTTVRIGNQEWIVENFRCTKYADGSAIANITDNGAWVADTDGAYCWYDNDIANKDDYGALYNWYAVDVDPSDSKDLAYLERSGVQESGWRVPTYTDLFILSQLQSNMGDAMKEIGTDYWNSPSNGNNSTGFYGRGSGQRGYSTGTFTSLKSVFLMWSDTEIDSDDSYAGVLSYNDTLFYPDNITKKGTGVSIRLVREFPTGDVSCDRTDLTSDSLVVTCDME